MAWSRAHRRAARPGHRVAGPPHGGAATSCAPPATSTSSGAAPASCSTRTSPAPRSRGCSTEGGVDRGDDLAFGTIDTLAGVEADRRRGARHRAVQRQPHDALRHRRAAMEHGAVRAARRARSTRCPRCGRRSATSAHVAGSAARRHARSPASSATSRRRSSARPASSPGMAKNTYGTGCFVLANVGATCPEPVDGLLTTVAWELGATARSGAYALEGAIFVTGAAVQWLRDGLGVIDDAADVEGWPARSPTAAGSSSSRPSPASARRGGTRTRGARCSASRGDRRPRTWLGRPSSRSPSRPATSSRR